MRFFAFVLAGAITACSSSSDADTTVRVADFDQRCAVDGDCVLAIDGDTCGGCANAAVAKTDARYTEARTAAAGSCANAATEGAPQCTSLRAVCARGTCAAR